MKKILFILHFPPPVHGSSIVGLSIKNSKIINGKFSAAYINLLVSRTLKETGRPSALKVLRFIKIFLSLFYELITNRPDMCYLALSTTGFSFYKDFFLVCILRAFRVKRVYHLHNKGVSIYNSALNKMLYRFVFRNADVILLSQMLYKDIQAYVPKSRVHICPNGIPDIETDAKALSHNKKSPVRALFLSNLLESKGVFVLLDACSALFNKGLDFECDFVGAEGDLTAEKFSEMTRGKNLSDKVRYLGKKYDREKMDIFSQSDIFIHPTMSDCFPLVLLEAMQHSLPVVSTFEGGIPDIVDDKVTGFLVPPGNSKVLARKLELLIEDQNLRKQMGKAGRKKYENELRLEIFEQRLCDILEKISNL